MIRVDRSIDRFDRAIRLSRRFDEGDDLKGFVRFDGRPAGGEEGDHLFEQVAIEGIVFGCDRDVANGLFAVGDEAVGASAGADAVHGAESAAGPMAGDDFRAVLFAASVAAHSKRRDSFAAGAEKREEHFDGVDAVVKEAGVACARRRGAVGRRAEDRAGGRVLRGGQMGDPRS